MQACVGEMMERGFGRIINVTSASVLMPLVGLDVSSAARAGLTAFLAGVSREVAPKGVTINNVLPGMFDTDRLKGSTRRMAELKASRRKTWPRGAKAKCRSAVSAMLTSSASSAHFWPAPIPATSPDRTS